MDWDPARANGEVNSKTANLELAVIIIVEKMRRMVGWKVVNMTSGEFSSTDEMAGAAPRRGVDHRGAFELTVVVPM